MSAYSISDIMDSPINNRHDRDAGITAHDGIYDSDWVKASFMVTPEHLDDIYDKANLYHTSAYFKFTDTRMGGSIGVNARPQFTPYSDMRIAGRIGSREEVEIGMSRGDYGMGRVYSEVFDDNAQKVYMRFGVTQFSALTRFFSTFVDSDVKNLVLKGRTDSALYTFSKIVGTVMISFSYPVATASVIGGKYLSELFFGRSTSKFYSLKPMMETYWATVTNLVNTHSVNVGIMPKKLNGDATQKLGERYELDPEYLDMMRDMYPDMLTENYGIDVLGTVTRAQRMANRMRKKAWEQLDNDDPESWIGYVREGHKKISLRFKDRPSVASALGRMTRLGYYVSKGPEDEGVLANDPKTSRNGEHIDQPEDGNSFMEHLSAVYDGGYDFAVFQVDHTGSVSESFSNSTKDSDLAEKFNTTSAGFRNMSFNFAGGNISDNIILQTIQGFIGGAKTVLEGLTSGYTLGLTDAAFAAMSGVNVEIPKQWDSASVDLPTMQYSMSLISPYNNPISRLQNIFIPLFMLLAGALPRKTGKQSYAGPYLCQVYDKGRAQTSLGVITSIQVTRGTSNLPFDRKGRALSLDVSFTVQDLSPIMSIPLATGGILNSLTSDKALDEDSVLSDYLAVLAGQSIAEQLWLFPRAKLAAAKRLKRLDAMTTPAAMALKIHENPISSAAMKLYTLGGWLRPSTRESQFIKEGGAFESIRKGNAAIQ